MDARHLLALSLETAAGWIDQHLPPPPNPELLTGFQNPPAPPDVSSRTITSTPSISLYSAPSRNSSTSLSNFSLERPFSRDDPLSSSIAALDPAHHSPSESIISPVPLPLASHSAASSPSNASSLDRPLPPFYSIPSNISISARCPSFDIFRTLSSQSFDPLVSPPLPPRPSEVRLESPVTETESMSLVQLYIGGLPRDYPTHQVPALFDEIGVRCLVKFCRNGSNKRGYALVLVRADEAAHCVTHLDHSKIDGWHTECQIVPERKNHEANENFVVFDRISSSLPSSPATSVSTFSLNLLIFKLPLNETLTALSILSSVPRFQIYRLFQENQSVAFISNTSVRVVDDLFTRLNGYELDGRKLEVVQVRRGMGAGEAIKFHLGNPLIGRRSTSFPRSSS